MGAGKKLWLYDSANEVWLPAECDADGYLKVDISLGGLYGINVETLTGNKTLTPGTDEMYQYLDEGGANRFIYLDTGSAVAGDRFIIRHNGGYNDGHYLDIRQDATRLDMVYAGSIKEFIFDGTNWISGSNGTGEDDLKARNVGIGYRTTCHNQGTAVGWRASAGHSGAAFGFLADAYSQGVAIGYNTDARIYGVAIGKDAEGISRSVAIGSSADTDSKKYAIALGYYAKNFRTAETSTNINGGDLDQENNVVQGRWEGLLAGGAGATEIFCGGQADERFTVRPSSHLAFKITVVARNDVADEGAMYTFEGLIKRDGADNTVLSVVNKTVVHEDDAAWDCDVTADDTNEALIITVTGDDTNQVQWAAVLEGVETHF